MLGHNKIPNMDGIKYITDPSHEMLEHGKEIHTKWSHVTQKIEHSHLLSLRLFQNVVRKGIWLR